MAYEEGSSSRVRFRMSSYRKFPKRETDQDDDPTTNEHAPTSRCGLFINILLILANDTFQKVVSYGLLYNLVIYLHEEYHMDMAEANNKMFYFNAATGFLPILFSFIADSYTGRFPTLGFGSVFSLLGLFLLWLTALIPQSRPAPCTPSGCASATGAQLGFIYVAFALISLGAAGLSSSTAFGVDQFHPTDESKRNRALERFFMYYHALSSFFVVITVTATAHVIENFGWEMGFRLPLILVVLFVILFFIRSPSYVKEKPKKDLIASFAQVIVVAFKNRNLPDSLPNSDVQYLSKKNSEIDVPSNYLSFLNKACIVKDPDQDIDPDGLAVDPWTLCTIEQVEELKALTKVFFLWSTGIMLWANISKHEFILLQAGFMNRQISENFKISRGAFATFSVIITLLWGFLYDHVVLPLASDIRGEPIHMGVKLRMGIGLLISWVAMVITAVVESIRRKKAIREGNSNDMSAMWLLPQHFLIGLGKAFTVTGQLEFLYTELPSSMSSVAVALLDPGMVLATWESDAVSKAVEGSEEVAWTDTDKTPLAYYYWVLVILNFINLLYFLLCSWFYGPCEGRKENPAEVADP